MPAAHIEDTILVSACLVDISCRYDGASAYREALRDLHRQGRLLPLCPEVAGGLGVPREPAVIVGGTGEDVLAGRARVMTQSGRDVTAEFLRGARGVVDLAERQGVRTAILKSRSPSCGVGQIHSEQGLRSGDGVLAAMLRRAGIRVISDEEWSATKE